MRKILLFKFSVYGILSEKKEKEERANITKWVDKSGTIHEAPMFSLKKIPQMPKNQRQTKREKKQWIAVAIFEEVSHDVPAFKLS